MDKVQNKERSNILPSPETFREELEKPSLKIKASETHYDYAYQNLLAQSWIQFREFVVAMMMNFWVSYCQISK
jgi:hypothetical protein